jgi:dolichol-phosphate mannosyltransferase
VSLERKAYVIAPVLNEAENMPTLISTWHELTLALPEWQFEFILLDDGSTDETRAAAEREATNFGVKLKAIRHETNLGPGAAFGTAFASIADRLKPDEIVVTMEGDNTSRIATLKTMLNRIVTENVEVALASPYAYGGGVMNTSVHRVVLSAVANGMIKGFLGIHGIHTMSSFFRAFRGSVILSLQEKWGPKIIERRGFECMVELLKKIVLKGFTITEVPMKLDTSLRKGRSKMKILRTARGYIAVMWLGRAWK